MKKIKVLVVDDDEIVRATLAGVLEQAGFEVTTSPNVPDALRHISGPQVYDVLVSDLHMPGAGDGLTVVSAMRHVNPAAVTLLLSAFPEMSAAAEAIVRQADEILVKPMDLLSLIEVIHHRVATRQQHKPELEEVASILERRSEQIIRHWYQHVQQDPSLRAFSITDEQRCAHLPELLRKMALRLQNPKNLDRREGVSLSAAEHGVRRFSHGYTAAMLVDEYRILQSSIFQCLQSNPSNSDYRMDLADFAAIADEISFQLSQSIASYTREMQLAA